MSHYVMDYETLSNCFIGCFIDYKDDTKKKVFVVHDLQNNFSDLLNFLDQNKNNKECHISYNGLEFDSQITQYILNNRIELSKLTGCQVARRIYKQAQDTINRPRDQFSQYPEWGLSITQVDVYKINHWDNVNKRTSLKWAMYAMDWYNLLEMPIHHTVEITTIEEIKEIVDYCENDVLATKAILYLSKPLIDVRKQIKAKYGLKCTNYSNTKLGSELLLKLYCNATDKKAGVVREERTFREVIPIKDIIFSYIEFQSLDFQGFHEMLKTRVIKDTKKDFVYNLEWKGYTFYYGAGGIHQCIERGIYREDNEMIIRDLDVSGMYPSIAVQNGMYPAHLGKEFFKVYKEDIIDIRLVEKGKPKEDRNIAIIEGFKEASNSAYGNSNSKYSWLCDPQYTMQTTINGQLLLTMLVEDLLLSIPGSQLLQTNTDGATLRFPKRLTKKYEEVCKKWEEKTKLTLEFADYKAMFIWDVNNYISLYKEEDKVKCKGRFEWEDLQNHKHTHLHKNKSNLIVAKAVFNYFVNDIIPEKYLAENRNIFDYCSGVKATGDWIFQQTCIVDQQVQRKTLQKTIRYYISKGGCKIIKHNTKDKRDIQVEAGRWMQQEYNKHEEKPFDQYEIDESYYLDKIYQEIHNLVPPKNNQLSLFN